MVFQVREDFHHIRRQFLEKEQASRLSQTLFAEDHFPKAALTGRSAHQAFLKGARERVPLPKAKGRVSLEMILPYPPGITVLEPGEVWTENIPFEETRDYVKRVLANTTNYAALITGQPQSLRARLGTVGPRPVSAPTANPDLP